MSIYPRSILQFLQGGSSLAISRPCEEISANFLPDRLQVILNLAESLVANWPRMLPTGVVPTSNEQMCASAATGTGYRSGTVSHSGARSTVVYDVL